MFDVDKLIQCVRDKPPLWDKSLPEYSEKNSREQSWQEIAQLMYSDWPELPLRLRDDKVKEIKNKWRHVRDNYMKSINQVKNKDVKKKKTYIYAESLAFLNNTKITKRNKTEMKTEEESENSIVIKTEYDSETIENEEILGNFCEVNVGTFCDPQYTSGSSATALQDVPCPPESSVTAFHDTQYTSGSSTRDLRNIKYTSSSSVSALHNTKYTPSSSATSGNKRNKMKLTIFQTELLKKLDTSSKAEEDDADKSFLMSILPDYKNLDDEEKLDFRIMCLQHFKVTREKRKRDYEIDN